MRACLVLDFDGTILDTEEPVYRSWAELYASLGQTLSLSEWQSIIGTDTGFDPWADLSTRVGRREPSLAQARRRRRDELQAAQDIRPGVRQWLAEAASASVPIGVASSSPPDWVDSLLRERGIRQHFAALVCSDGTVPPKPDPTSYRTVCELLDADPARSVAVEDSPHGITAAVAAGLFTIAVPHGLTADLDLSAADVVIESLHDMTLEQALARARA